MDHIHGVDRLKVYLGRTRQYRALEELDGLERQLQRTSNAERILNALDTLSWRTTARPFNTWAHERGFGIRLSLKGTAWGILLLVAIPALLLGLTTLYLVSAHKNDFLQDQQTVIGIDAEINREIIAPFYLDPRPQDPCSPGTVEKVELPDDMRLVMDYRGGGGVSCTWAYHKNNAVIAVDTWSFTNRVLLRREYFQDGSYLATDVYNLGLPACVKERTYFGNFAPRECYSENGRLVSINPQLAWVSPLPPMVYWFFYR